MPIDRAETLRNAEKLLRQGKLDQAIAEYVRVVEEQPRDWNTANSLGDLYMRAGRSDKALEQFTRIADSLNADGFLPKAAAIYKKILKINPHDEPTLSKAADLAARQGLLVDARAFLSAVCERQRLRGDTRGLAATMVRLAALDPADVNARLAGARAQMELGQVAAAVRDLRTLADEMIEAGRLDQALIALREARIFDPQDADVKRALGQLLVAEGGSSAAEGQEIVNQLVEAAAARGDWTAAADALEEFLERVPQHIPALLRLVEIAVDGEMETRISVAQARLADAYLATGSVAEARYITEDLVAREPENEVHRERLKGILALLGESTDFVGSRGSEGSTDSEGSHALEPIEPIEPLEPFEPSEPVEPLEPRKIAKSEIDLSVVLKDIDRPALAPVVPIPPPKDIETVFAELRDESNRLATNDADQALATGIALFENGDLDAAVPPLQTASRAPRLRFAAAGALGRIFLQRGSIWQAIEWLERAAEAPAPTPGDGHRLLFELADALEAAGEVARALAICLELRAEAGEYEDVDMRIERLVNVQARG